MLLFIPCTREDQQQLAIWADVFGGRIRQLHDHSADWSSSDRHGGERLFASNVLGEVELLAVGHKVPLGRAIVGQLRNACNLNHWLGRQSPSGTQGGNRQDGRGRNRVDGQSGDSPRRNWSGGRLGSPLRFESGRRGCGFGSSAAGLLEPPVDFMPI